MVEFLDSFDVNRGRIMDVLTHLDTVWDRFQERAGLDVKGTAESLITTELSLAARDLAQAQFTVGVFGLIKRGKSTLLNALIGREVSSMHVTPETAVPVYVGYAERPQAVVHFADGRSEQCVVDEINRFTSQKFNKNNELGVTHVEQWVPVGFLRNGTRLIDTPGLDDAEADEVYTTRTMQELDAVDAGIIVFLSPPTVGATEMNFLTDVMTTDLSKAFLVCNMYPQHFHDKETRNAVLDYVGKRVVETCKKAGLKGTIRLYPVCALEAWDARQAEDVDAWKRSGADRVLRDLENHLAEHAGTRVLGEAAERVAKVAEMAVTESQVRMQLLEDPERLGEHRAQLDMNIRELESAFNNAVAGAAKEVDQLKLRVRGTVVRPFTNARSAIHNASTVDELQSFSKRFRREVEVAGESASRQFADGFTVVVNRVRAHLEEHFKAVMSDLAPNAPNVRLTSGSLMSVPETVKSMSETRGASATTTVSGFAGGLAGAG
ncbi:MAG: GTPase SAR1 family protein, partial [Glaciecola sp.]